MKLFTAISLCNLLICNVEFASEKSLVYGESTSGKEKSIDKTLNEIDRLLGKTDINFESKSLAPNLDNPQELENVIKQAVDMSKLTEEIIGNDKLIKLNNIPFSGWAKGSANGKNGLLQFRFGKADGQSMFWYKNGQRSAWVEMKNNQPHGIILGWHKNGAMALKGEMKNGFLEGLCIMWYENGQKENESFYTDKKLEKIIVWKPNGEKCGVTNVVAGNGISVAYSSDNQESEMIVYKAGKEIRKEKIDN